jgi:uncharacterized protein (TIGR03435 family)
MQNVGLKLDARKLPLDVITVDHLERGQRFVKN